MSIGDWCEERHTMANAARFLAADAVQRANSGHPGMAMGAADFLSVLFADFLRIDPDNPYHPGRDRFILSAGHGSALLYSLMTLSEYPDSSMEELAKFRSLGSKAAGHPEFGSYSGIEVTTGPLGQGLANAVGIAKGAKLLSQRFQLPETRCFVTAGDGCLMEGIGYEACSLAGHWNLNNLFLLFDSNRITIDGPVGLAFSENIEQRFIACGWRVIKADGHDLNDIKRALLDAENERNLPTLIEMKTVIAKGSPNKEGLASSHGAPLGEDEIKAAKKIADWDYDAFEIPDYIRKMWYAASRARKEWFNKWDEESKNNSLYAEFAAFNKKSGLKQAINALIDFRKIVSGGEATRKSSMRAISVVADNFSGLLGGSADLTGSNCVMPEPMNDQHVSPLRYLRYGIREHAMVAIMNGLALMNFTPYGGTFLVFSDYCRPSIRMAALMKLQCIFVMTHDSIGVGEDGPTHQPVEHLASFRAMPGLFVMRPADAVETVECWEMALRRIDGPSILALSRQNVPLFRDQNEDGINKSSLGMYEVLNAGKYPDIRIFSSGSELSLSLEVAKKIGDVSELSVSVFSCPCFEAIDKEKIPQVRSASKLNIVIEAASSFGWTSLVGVDAEFFCIDRFGESGAANDVFNYFGFNVDSITDKILNLFKKRFYSR